MGFTILPAGARDRLAGAALTYREVGQTAGDLPEGYHHLTRRVLIGHGQQLFTETGDAVRHWQVQVRAGLRVSASVPAAAPGAAVVLGLGIGPMRVRAPCRVVYTVDEPRRQGFAYGTLPGHPESGEEAFVIEHHGDDTVSFTITAFSRPATRLARIAGPLGRTAQRRITARYLRSLASLRPGTGGWRQGRRPGGQSRAGRPRIGRRSRKSVIVWSGTQPGWALVP
jgi:uncharacterized protein (UPF0548 family)